MSYSTDTFIAGKLMASDWTARKAVLAAGNAEDWGGAFTDFFFQRLQLRYFNPIEVLKTTGSEEGEGFSIVAIQCSLVEFLESTAQGMNFKLLTRGQTLGPYEYSRSKEMFVAFLRNRPPFSTIFTTSTLALDFYENVRCGLLHEARTKGGWKIRAGNGSEPIVDTAARIVYRNKFQQGLLDYIESYRADLRTVRALQEAFVRKLDGLCV